MTTAIRQRGGQPALADVRELVHSAVARLHFGDEPLCATGRFDIRRGSGVAVRLASTVLRLPPSARRVRLKLHIERDGKREVWHRSFGGRSLDASFDHDESGQMIEGFGPLRLHYRMRAQQGALVLELASVHLRLGPMAVRLPRWASPVVRARAWVRDDDRLVHACIIVVAPWGDLLLAYRGCLDEVKSWTE